MKVLLAKPVLLLLCACLVYSRATNTILDPNLVKEFQQDNQKKTVQELEEAAVSSDDGHGGENDDMKFDDDKINEEANTHEKEIEATTDDSEDVNGWPELKGNNPSQLDGEVAGSNANGKDVPETEENQALETEETQALETEETQALEEEADDASAEDNKNLDQPETEDNTEDSTEDESETEGQEDDQLEKMYEKEDSDDLDRETKDTDEKNVELEEEKDIAREERKEEEVDPQSEDLDSEEKDLNSKEKDIEQEEHAKSSRCNYVTKKITIRQPFKKNRCLLVRYPILKAYRMRYVKPYYKCRKYLPKIYYTKKICGLLHKHHYCNVSMFYKIVKKVVCYIRYVQKSVTLKRIVYKYRIVKRPRYYYKTKVYIVKKFQCTGY